MEDKLKKGNRRRPFDQPREKDGPRVNDEIRVARVLVIDNNGERLGTFLTEDAIALAKERGFDLVEVAPNARPPVCKFADFGKMQYERSKKEAAARRRQHRVQVKEIKIRPKTNDHDMDVKTRHAMRFLRGGNKVKVTVWFRGREHAHHEIGEDQCKRFAAAVGEYGTIEFAPKMEGRYMIMIMAPTGFMGEGDVDLGPDDEDEDEDEDLDIDDDESSEDDESAD